MTGTVLRKPSPTSAMFVNMMRGQSDEVKLEVATYLLASVTNKNAVAETPPPPPAKKKTPVKGLFILVPTLLLN